MQYERHYFQWQTHRELRATNTPKVHWPAWSMSGCSTHCTTAVINISSPEMQLFYHHFSPLISTRQIPAFKQPEGMTCFMQSKYSLVCVFILTINQMTVMWKASLMVTDPQAPLRYDWLTDWLIDRLLCATVEKYIQFPLKTYMCKWGGTYVSPTAQKSDCSFLPLPINPIYSTVLWLGLVLGWTNGCKKYRNVWSQKWEFREMDSRRNRKSDWCHAPANEQVAAILHE